MWKLVFKIWRIASDVALGAAATCALTSCLHDEARAAPPPPPPSPPPISKPAKPNRKQASSEYRIEARITSGNRCMVPGVSVNGRGPLQMLADSGAPDVWFPVEDLPALGIARSSLNFRPFGAREGNVAWVTLDSLRIGDFTAHNVEAAISDGKEFDYRLLGMSVLKQGHMEIEGNTCTLTFPRNAAVQSASVDEPRSASLGQCREDALSKLNADSLDRVCWVECFGAPFCRAIPDRQRVSNRLDMDRLIQNAR
jgi:clan AA aspartic protease (TIGR02281 family)